jgi:hypothetical protein
MVDQQGPAIDLFLHHGDMAMRQLVAFGENHHRAGYWLRAAAVEPIGGVPPFIGIAMQGDRRDAFDELNAIEKFRPCDGRSADRKAGSDSGDHKAPGWGVVGRHQTRLIGFSDDDDKEIEFIHRKLSRCITATVAKKAAWCSQLTHAANGQKYCQGTGRHATFRNN